jgi:hypothetical protein
VPGSASGEQRQLRVHLWYPADKRAYRRAVGTVYTSRLHEQALLPDDRWAPLSWSVKAQIARETDEADGKQKPLRQAALRRPSRDPAAPLDRAPAATRAQLVPTSLRHHQIVARAPVRTPADNPTN